MPDPVVVNENPSALDLEPIRLPSWAVSLIVIFVVPLGTAFLTDQDWKPVAAGALAAVVPLLVVSERARSKVVPTVTHEAAIAEAVEATAVEVHSAAVVEGREQGRADLAADLGQIVDAQVEETRVAREAKNAARRAGPVKAVAKKAQPRKAR